MILKNDRESEATEMARFRRAERRARETFRLRAITIDKLINLRESIEHWETIKCMLEARETTLQAILSNSNELDKIDVSMSRELKRLSNIAVEEIFDIEGALAKVEHSIEKVIEVAGCGFVPRLYNPVTIRSLYNEGN